MTEFTVAGFKVKDNTIIDTEEAREACNGCPFANCDDCMYRDFKDKWEEMVE